ncbi:uncharacterized protein C6orf118 homolog isoform X2 [Hemicordylus capensis]|uniref:uncharacterized protein C6orf118 homolog isoform X2 n=1 Tax=Hemicordylus capensis TaxID=884348 RepID=UPI00230274C4|nr:uncharacterized protein C6orf118 homolog isoform X2 [Hemicordylus capensis]
MANRKQKNDLVDLLDGVEKAHKAEVQLYTSGHLNVDKLFKPKNVMKHNYWESATKSAFILRKRSQITAPTQASRKTKDTLVSFRDAAPLTSTRAKSASLFYRPSLASKVSPRSPARASLGASSFHIQRKAATQETKEAAGISQKPRIREELDVPEMKMLKYKPTLNSRLCVMEETKDEYTFLPSYLASVTKTDQFHKFMQFQKNFIAKKDLLDNDYVGSKSAEHHEKKLAQALRNICDCSRPHYNRLQAVGDVFEDICNSSLIFGDILKEVKNEYELYMVILLDSLPTMQYRTLQNEVKGMEKRTVKTHEIEEARHEIQLLVKKSKWALERNEELRNELEMELWVSQSTSDVSEKESDHLVEGETPLSSGERLASLRCQILIKWEEIKAKEKEIKDTMVFAGIANIKEKTVKELEVEASKLNASNKFLRKQIKDVEHNITLVLKRQKISTDIQQYLWDLVEGFLTPEEKEDPLENVEASFCASEIFH